MSAWNRVNLKNAPQGMTSSSQSDRALLWVSNNKDDGEGSLRSAIDQGHELVKQGKAIEIAFTGNFRIKPIQEKCKIYRNMPEQNYIPLCGSDSRSLTAENYDYTNRTNEHQYTIYGGDWLINNRNTKNITIDGSSQKSLGWVRPLFGIQYPSKTGKTSLVPDYSIEPTRVDISRINLVNNEVKGGAIKGSGGSLATGAAVLHWGGHLTWRDSVIQKNKVSGGIGESGAKGGNGWYRHGFKNSSISRPSTIGYPLLGFDGGGAGGSHIYRSTILRNAQCLNGRPCDYWQTWGDGGSDKSYSKWDSRRRSAPGDRGEDAGENFNPIGLAGQGGGGGAGGGVKNVNQFYERSNPNVWGSGFKGGRGGHGSYGAGGGAGGGGGGNAGTNAASGFNWSTARTPSWSPAQPGVGGRGGEWATDGTSGGKPSRQNGGNGGRGGDGAALGSFTSFAIDDEKSSLKLNNVDFIDNQADGGANVGRFRDIFSRNIVVENRDVTLSSGGQLQESTTVASATPVSLNVDHSQTDKTQVYDASGRFKKLESSPYAPKLILAASYTKIAGADIALKEFLINPNEDSVVDLRVYHDQLYTHSGEIIGSENLLKAVNQITNYVYKTPTEAEIRGTRGNTQALYRGTQNTGSFTDGVVSSSIKDFGFAVGGLATEDGFLSKMIPKSGITALGYLGPAAGVLGFVGEVIFTRLEEDRRIEQELASKKLIEEKKQQVKDLIPDEISIEPFKLIDEQTIDILRDFKFGRDQIMFPKSIRPVFAEYSPEGSVYIKASSKGKGVVDNSAKVIAQINLPDNDNLLIKGTGNSNEKYFNSLLHLLEFGEGENKESRYVLSKDTDWNYLWTNDSQYKPITGFANDRVIIDRSKGGSGLANTDPLTISTFSGDDRILGDSGKNIIIAGSGSDYIAPGLGEDSVIGGLGFDTVDYIVGNDNPVTITALSNSDVWTVAGVNSQLSLDSSLSNVESLRVPGGSSIDLSNAKAPTAIMSSVRDVSNDSVSDASASSESETSSANSSELEGEAAYLVATRAGGSFTGSNHNDVIYIEFSDSDLSPNSVQNTTVKGGAGTNALVINGFARLIENETDGKKYFFEVSQLSSDPNEGKIFSIVKNDEDKILSRTLIFDYENINNFAIVDILTDSDDSNRISYTTYEASADVEAGTDTDTDTDTGADTGTDTGSDTGASADVFDSVEIMPIGDLEGWQNPARKGAGLLDSQLFDSFETLDSFETDNNFGKIKEYEFRTLTDGDKKSFSGQPRFGDNNLISGDRYGNLLFGTQARDKIRSRGGGDTIVGGNGNDVIRAGNGKDMIDGGKGRNRLFGGNGADGFHLRQNGHQIISDFEIGKDYFILNGSMDPRDFEFEDNGRLIIINDKIVASIDLR